MAMARNTNICTIAIATLIPMRAVTTDDVLTGANLSLRSSLSFRQPTRVIDAPNAAPDAIAQPSRPGARYWIGLSDLSSTCAAVNWYVGGPPGGGQVGLLHDRGEHPRSRWRPWSGQRPNSAR